MNPNLFAVIEESMGEYCDNRRKFESVCDSEGGRKEDRTVGLEVQQRVIVDDPGNVVCFAGVIEGE